MGGLDADRERFDKAIAELREAGIEYTAPLCWARGLNDGQRTLGLRTKMIAKWGILVAVGADTGEGKTPAKEIDGLDAGRRPLAMGHEYLLLTALGSVWSVLESMPFLYLVTPLGAWRYIFEPALAGSEGSYRKEGPFPSVEAATREYERSGPGVRLVLVHPDIHDGFLNPGLLPWLSRFAPGYSPERLKTLSITDLLEACIDPGSSDAVMVATLRQSEDSSWLQAPWDSLMGKLKHQELKGN